jgi:hypothetical protein
MSNFEFQMKNEKLSGGRSSSFLIRNSKFNRIAFMPKRLALALLLVSITLQAAPPKPYHIELEANPAAPFPFLSKFGTVTLHVYPAGVRAETIWLNGFSRNGSRAVTVENPYGRMYTDVPVDEITTILKKMSALREQVAVGPPPIAPPLSGSVHGIAARRYRLMYGPEAWIDIWTTARVPDNLQFRAIVNAFVRGISPGTAQSLAAIPGMPLYVELNFSHYKKLPLLRLKKFLLDDAGQEKALKVGVLYFKAPLLDAIWK